MKTQARTEAETAEECSHSASVLKQPWFPCPEMVLATVGMVLKTNLYSDNLSQTAKGTIVLIS